MLVHGSPGSEPPSGFPWALAYRPKTDLLHELSGLELIVACFLKLINTG